MSSSFRIKAPIVFVLALVVGFVTQQASASHIWGNYHWARTSNPFTIKLGNNLQTAWQPYLTQAAADWDVSSVLNTTVVSGLVSSRTCKATSGRVEVCNNKYGSNGWLGIASIWASDSHITQATVKLNDSYFNTTKYNKPEWKQFVMCQEIGHTFGLNHQDENFSNANLNTCMDYTNSPLSNQTPNQHDYGMLEDIYTHLDTSTTVTSSTASNGNDIDHNNRSTWGKSIRTSSDGNASLFVKETREGQVFTFVIWADEEAVH